MDQNKKPLMYLVVLLTALSLFLSGVFVGKIEIKRNQQKNPDYYLTGNFYEKSKEVNVNILWDAWKALEDNYITEDLDGKKLLNGSVKGLVDSLNDPYTYYLGPEETKGYLSDNASTFEGVGITLRTSGEYVVVETPLDGYPGRKAGLEPGDMILKVDGEDMKNQSTVYAASKIRGAAGSKVKLTVYKVKVKKEQEYEITREKIDLDNVAFEKLDNGIVKIKIIKFTEDSVEAYNQQWDKVVEQVLAENPKGVIIDLRNNPGGFVDAAKYSVSEFLDKGKVILSEEDRNGGRHIYKVERTGQLRKVPVVIIVNEGSASAAEIFAGSLQANGRAKIVGKKTVGKGVEQRIVNLADGASMHVVFRKWILPSGKNVSKDDPLIPDYDIEYSIEDFNKNIDPQLDKALELLKS